MFGSSSWINASRSGAGFSAHAERVSAIAKTAGNDFAAVGTLRLAPSLMSVQLQDQVVDLGADAQNHLAKNLDGCEVIGVDRTVSHRAGWKEHPGLIGIDRKLHRKTALRWRGRPGL